MSTSGSKNYQTKDEQERTIAYSNVIWYNWHSIYNQSINYYWPFLSHCLRIWYSLSRRPPPEPLLAPVFAETSSPHAGSNTDSSDSDIQSTYGWTSLIQWAASYLNTHWSNLTGQISLSSLSPWRYQWSDWTKKISPLDSSRNAR